MLSIVIPVYNYTIVDLVQELNNQLIPLHINYEIIAWDDHSFNNHCIDKNKTITQFPNCFYYQNETNLGRTQTRNLLSQKAKFDWLLFLDADVIPANSNFLEKYTQLISNNYDVIFGGYSYQESEVEKSTFLRWKYGQERESTSAEVRSQNPYNNLFSGNILIQKSVFNAISFPTENWYGMDIYFAYSLFQMKAQIHHCNNPIYHLGLETNEVFFKKSLEAVKSRIVFLENQPQIETVNSLLKHYKTIKKWRLKGLIRLAFTIIEPILRRNILSHNPNLFLFDVYRLGYSCTLKE
jgi:glycosyltransferase involved in cell wall biosynthesis